MWRLGPESTNNIMHLPYCSAQTKGFAGFLSQVTFLACWLFRLTAFVFWNKHDFRCCGRGSVTTWHFAFPCDSVAWCHTFFKLPWHGVRMNLSSLSAGLSAIHLNTFWFILCIPQKDFLSVRCPNLTQLILSCLPSKLFTLMNQTNFHLQLTFKHLGFKDYFSRLWQAGFIPWTYWHVESILSIHFQRWKHIIMKLGWIQSQF